MCNTAPSASKKGILYGQCSDLCSANRAFMPIVIEAVSLEDNTHLVSFGCLMRLTQHYLTVHTLYLNS